jgi:hypothetical protein
MLLDRLLVEGIDHGHLSGSASGCNFCSNPLKLLTSAPGQKDPGAFASEGQRHTPADPPCPSINDSILILSSIFFLPLLYYRVLIRTFVL